jgi:hypothetical protein
MSDTTADPSNNGTQTGDGRFKPGNPGGPGRREGSRNKATLLLDALADGEAETILSKQIEKAKEGDQRAAEFILGRAWPARRGRPVTVQLPPIETAADLVKALGVVANAVAGGELSPEEGDAVASILDAKRRAIETTDVLARIEALERERAR